MAGSSSEPSRQSLSPSHFHVPRIQRPVELHLNSFSGHGMSQSFSSDPSPQSSTPSQSVVAVVQLLFLHWNWPDLQKRSKHELGSSVPSWQSFSPSHFQYSGIQRLSLPPHRCCPAVQLAIQVFPSGAKMNWLGQTHLKPTVPFLEGDKRHKPEQPPLFLPHGLG